MEARGVHTNEDWRHLNMLSGIRRALFCIQQPVFSDQSMAALFGQDFDADDERWWMRPASITKSWSGEIQRQNVTRLLMSFAATTSVRLPPPRRGYIAPPVPLLRIYTVDFPKNPRYILLIAFLPAAFSSAMHLFAFQAKQLYFFANKTLPLSVSWTSVTLTHHYVTARLAFHRQRYSTLMRCTPPVR